MNVSIVLLKKVMFMNKKGVELTINTVVIAVLAVLVLVVLFYVFTNKMGGLTGTLNTCPGSCVDTEQTCVAKNGVIIRSVAKYTDCTDTVPLCCSL